MQKNCFCGWSARGSNRHITKTMLVMKLTIVLLTIGFLNVSAEGVSQNVSFSGEKVSLKSVFHAVEKQTGFVFLYNRPVLKECRPVTIAVTDMPLDNFLKEIFNSQPLKYKIDGRSILVSPKSPDADRQPGSYGTYDLCKDIMIDIKGRVVNENGEPVLASVLVKGTTNGTTTNADGFFELENVNENATLVISGVSLEKLEVRVNGKTELSITVKINAAEAEAVVVKTNYWEVKQKENPGNISRVDNKVIERQPVINPLEALSGRVPGLNIIQQSGLPGGPVTVQIRGLNSLRREGNNPLFLVDGVPFTFETTASRNVSGNTFLGTPNPLNVINVSDIESIDVLKDADATAIYGSRGANGVILITTKKGRSSNTKVAINFNTGFSEIAKRAKMLNTAQYLQVREEAFKNDGITPGANDFDVNGTWDKNRYTDWGETLNGGKANNTNTQISLSGGNANTRYLVSGSYQKTTTIFSGDFYYNRYATHLAVNNVSDNQKFKADFTLNYTADKNRQMFGELGTTSFLPPNAPALYKDDGTLNWENYTWENPLAVANAWWISRNYNLITNAKLSYTFLPGLQFSTSVGYNNIVTKEIRRLPTTYYNPSWGVTSTSTAVAGATGTGNRQSWIIEPQLNASKKWGRASFNVLVGATFQDDTRDLFHVEGLGFPSDDLIGNMRAARYQVVRADELTKYRYNAVYGRINGKWDEKYIINLTGRRDGSSRFGPGKQFANFGAAGVAWIFSRENFITNSLPFLSFGKLRSSYGTSGNDQIGDYQFLNSYSIGTYYNGAAGLQPVRLFNPDFAWEITRKLEAGLELGFLQDKINLSVSYYHNRSSNQLINYTLPGTTGFTGIQANLGATVQNTGMEVELNTNNVNNKHFRWNSSFSLTVPRNKLVSFPGIESSTYFNIYFVGRSLFTNAYYQYNGIDPQTGIYQFTDANNDGLISYANDRISLVEATQRYYGGFSNTLGYKNWELDVFFQFVNQKGKAIISSPGGRYNIPEYMLDRWQKPGDNATFQRFSTGQNAAVSRASTYFSQSDGIIMDASFARLKNLSVAYKIRAGWLKGMGDGRIYVQGQNLWTITNYMGADPENTTAGFTGPMRSFAIGVQIAFQ